MSWTRQKLTKLQQHPCEGTKQAQVWLDGSIMWKDWRMLLLIQLVWCHESMPLHSYIHRTPPTQTEPVDQHSLYSPSKFTKLLASETHSMRRGTAYTTWSCLIHAETSTQWTTNTRWLRKRSSPCVPELLSIFLTVFVPGSSLSYDVKILDLAYSFCSNVVKLHSNVSHTIKVTIKVPTSTSILPHVRFVGGLRRLGGPQ